MKKILYKDLSDNQQRYIDDKNAQLRLNNVSLKVIGAIFSGNESISHSKAVVFCEEHCDCSLFGTPYTPTFSNLRLINNTGCTKCSGKYKDTKEEASATAIGALNANGCDFLGFIDEIYEGRKSKLNYLTRCCKEIKEITLNQAINGKVGCKTCNHKAAARLKCKTGEDILKSIKERFPEASIQWEIDPKEKYRGNDVIDGFCNRHQSRVTKQIVKLYRSSTLSPCAKCSKEIQNQNQKFTIVEQEVRIANALKRYPNLDFHFEHIDEGNNTRIALYCKLHKQSFTARIGNILSGKANCKHCAFNSHHLNDLLNENNPSVFFNPRTFYIVHFRHQPSGEEWFKVGVTTNGINGRYSPKQLKKDNLEIVAVPVQVHTDSLTALLVEKYILLHEDFCHHRVAKFHRMVAVSGGSECFSRCITTQESIHSLIANAFSSRSTLILYLGLIDSHRTRALQLVNDYIEQKNIIVGEQEQRMPVKKFASLRKQENLNIENLILALLTFDFKVEKTANYLELSRSSLRYRMKRLDIYETIKHIKKHFSPSERRELTYEQCLEIHKKVIVR